MYGFNQSEIVFRVWSVVLDNQNLASFDGIFGQKSFPIGNTAPFWVLLHIVVSDHKNSHFCSSCRIQSEVQIKDLKKLKICTEAIAKLNYQMLFAVKKKYCRCG